MNIFFVTLVILRLFDRHYPDKTLFLFKYIDYTIFKYIDYTILIQNIFPEISRKIP